MAKTTITQTQFLRRFLELNNVNFRNLSNLNISLPLGRFIVCCGVSGAGKSSLVRGPLYKGVKKSIQQKTNKIKTENYELRNGNQFAKAIEVSQSPIGKTSRSTPVTYLGVWTRIRSSSQLYPRQRHAASIPVISPSMLKGAGAKFVKEQEE